jgi:uncharacterized protein (TIGR01619 family)
MSDDWDFYLAKVDHKPASIMVDLGIKDELPFPNHPYMVYLRVYMKQARPDGLSSNEEFQLLCEIGDAVDNLVKETHHLFVGRNTSDGNRDFYFYTADSDILIENLSTMMKSFEGYEFDVGKREDKAWDVYKDFLYPEWKAKQGIMNRRVCEALRNNGDNNALPRKIDHWAYFNSKQKLANYVDYLKDHDFIILKQGKEKPLFGKRFVNFEKIGIPQEIDNLVIELCEKATDLGGEYDGWGCTVRDK